MPVKALKLDYVIVWGTKGDCPVPQLGFRVMISSDRIVRNSNSQDSSVLNMFEIQYFKGSFVWPPHTKDGIQILLNFFLWLNCILHFNLVCFLLKMPAN